MVQPDDAVGALDQRVMWGELGRRVRFLGAVPLFANSDIDVLANIAAAMSPVHADADQVIVREGDPADRLYVVESGSLSVQISIGERTVEIGRLGAGEFFGEIAVLGDVRRTATVRAEQPCELWQLSADALREVLAREPALAAELEETAASRRAARPANVDLGPRSLLSLVGDTPRIRIGRAAYNDIVVDSPLVGEQHAVLERRKGGGYRLTDVSGGADTLVNGRPVATAELSDGDEIVLGDERFVFDRSALVQIQQRPGIRIDALDVGVTVKGGKRLLHDVSLTVLPGELVAVVGGSGAGKSTLLDALAGRRPATEGTVLYNGYDYYGSIDRYRHVIGYVPQDDIVHTELPLEQTLRYAAELRLPPGTSDNEIGRVVDSTLHDLDLAGRADVRVGALSGGQRKRSSIAAELLTQPRAFFLDEPTSGLDPATEAQTMELLRRLADRGSTVLVTTHATASVMRCDKIVVLARDGHLAFVGTPTRALTYFGVETFAEVYELLAEGDPADWARRFDESDEQPAALPSPTGAAHGAAGAGARGAGRGVRVALHQLGVLSRRNVTTHVRDKAVLMPLIMQPIGFAALLLVIFQSGLFDPETANPMATMQVLFIFSFMTFLFGLLFGIQEIVRELPIFFRERMVGVRVAPYLLSKVAFLGPIMLFATLAMTALLWATGRLPDGGFEIYGPLVLTQLLSAFVGLALALFTSAASKSTQQANDMLTVWISPQVLFAGALIAVPEMPLIGRVLSAVVPVRWAFEASGHATRVNELFGEAGQPMGQALLEQYETTFASAPGRAWLILAAFVLVPMLLAVRTLSRRQPPS